MGRASGDACPHGHVWTAETTRWVKSRRHGGKSRSCRVCAVWRVQAYRARRLGIPEPPRPAPDAGYEKASGAVGAAVPMPEVLEQVKRVGSCWVWRGEVWPNGVPRFEGGVAVRVVARAVWGRRLPDGAGVEMLCGTDRCVNPDHARLLAGGPSAWCDRCGKGVSVSPRLLRAGSYTCEHCRGAVLRSVRRAG